MFLRFVGPLTCKELDIFEVRFGLPPRDYRCDAFLISGSRFSVNDDHPWIARLKGFVREGEGRNMRFAGFCFGHQVIAAAMGGTVGTSPLGWNVGKRQVRLNERSYLSKAYRRETTMIFNHGEQVRQAPPDAKVLAGDDRCPVQIFQLGQWALGCQGHPEYTADYQNDLMANNLALTPDVQASARLRNASMLAGSETALMWLEAFLDS